MHNGEMRARTCNGRFLLGLASSLAFAACAAESTPARPAPTSTPSTDGPLADLAPSPPDAEPDGPLADLAPSPPDAGPDAPMPVLPPPVQPRKVLIVVGDTTTFGESDVLLSNFLFDQLDFLEVVADDGENPALSDPSLSLIVISSSVDPAVLGARYRTTKLPVVVLHAGVFSAMGMTGSVAGAFGTASAASIFVTPEGGMHPIGEGYPHESEDALEVARAPIQLNFGVPATSATVVATLASNSDRAALFTYETGAAMFTLEAPARRAGSFWFDAEDDITASGEELLERVFMWTALGHL
jgi:hypothetical protein